MKNIKNFSIFPLIMGLFLVLFSSCEKDDEVNNGQQNVPVVSTADVTDVTTNTATSGGNITDDGGASVTARGVCWSTSDNPTIAYNKTEDGTDVGIFTSSVTGLEPNTTYYLRAYATNSAGAGYGSVMTFTTENAISFGTFTDPRDGWVYETVTIGNQTWFAENLNYEIDDGTWSWCYDNDASNCNTYGRLYRYRSALTACPDGWHLPSKAEWDILIDYLGGPYDAAGKMKSTTGWNVPNTDASNSSGFTALPGGYGRNQDNTDDFGAIGQTAYWWTATEQNSSNAAYITIGRAVYGPQGDQSWVSWNNIGKSRRHSCRCLKD